MKPWCLIPAGIKSLALNRPAVRQAALCLGLNTWPPFKDRHPRTGAAAVTGPLCNCTVFNGAERSWLHI